MAGMLPGVECARRRRIRQGVAEAPCGTRRPSLCLYAGGHDHAHLGSSSGRSKERSSECKEPMPRAWMLDSNAREAKERLDQKLRGQREPVVKISRRSQSTRTKAQATTTSHGIEIHPAADEAPTTAGVLQREVLSKQDVARRRFIWSRLERRPPPPAEAVECAVCLEDLRAGDVLVHLPCAHRFHWACAVPWVKTAARCPVCRAQVHLAGRDSGLA